MPDQTNLARSVVAAATAAGLVLRLLLISGMRGPFLFQDELSGPLIARWINGSDSRSFSIAGSLLYGLLLTPLQALFDDPLAFYRSALVLNALLATALTPLLFLIGRRALGYAPLTAAMAATAGGLTASSFAYSVMVLPEVLLMFTATASVLVMHRYAARPSPLAQIALVVSVTLVSAAHQRGAVIAIAAMLTIGWLWASGQLAVRDCWLPLLGIPAGWVGVGALNGWIHGHFLIDGSPETSGPMEIVEFAFTGTRQFVVSGLGMSLYLMAATGGLVVLALLGVVVGGAAKAPAQPIAVFVGLATLGTAVLALSFVTGVALNDPRRVDSFMYGRYVEFLLPVVLIFIPLAWRVRPLRYLSLAIALAAVIAGGAAANRNYLESFWLGANAQSNSSGAQWLKLVQNVLNMAELWPYVLGLVCVVGAVSLFARRVEAPLVMVAGIGVAAGVCFVVLWANNLGTPPPLVFGSKGAETAVVAVPIDNVGSQHAQLLAFWNPHVRFAPTASGIDPSAGIVILREGTTPPAESQLIATDGELGLVVWRIR